MYGVVEVRNGEKGGEEEGGTYRKPGPHHARSLSLSLLICSTGKHVFQPLYLLPPSAATHDPLDLPVSTSANSPSWRTPPPFPPADRIFLTLLIENPPSLNWKPTRGSFHLPPHTQSACSMEAMDSRIKGSHASTFWERRCRYEGSWGRTKAA
ncbi:hypothetical protein FA13DRAFT_1908895 [Coprinellus micaceus]|uniref:Uncharacterized protein n=1 Tax=Coprinellus micaceus TaxID=71717 RepID=A0A4Y7SRN3_COPMI|nr:hypothetical protein FA13DRAFT_1908895 [Coprinellus micaceus]